MPVYIVNSELKAQQWNCVTQLKLDTVEKLSSTIFCCLSVSVSGIGNARPNLHFIQYIQAYKPFADHLPPNTKQYQLILTKYQPVSSYTDQVPSSTTYNLSSRKAQFSQLNNLSFYDSFDESRTVYLVMLATLSTLTTLVTLSTLSSLVTLSTISNIVN